MTSSSVFPLLPLRDVVVFPHMVIPLFVGRSKSIEALEAAMQGDKQVLLMTQRNPAVDDPEAEDLYRVGTLATILQLLKLPDGTIKVLVEGVNSAARSSSWRKLTVISRPASSWSRSRCRRSERPRYWRAP